jgi:8-oxo-dGTP pyrophosphatase MutT (NUDIX family)
LAGHHAEFVHSISSLLSQEEPIELLPSETAAVAVIFGDAATGKEQILLIRRSDREGDPWSGHIALPGGRVEKEDGSFKAAAVRETREEVGIELDANAQFLGYLGPFQARTRSIWVVPSVFLSDDVPIVTSSAEVASYKWMPFQEIVAPDSRSTYEPKEHGESRPFPAFERDGYLVWGLTERILSTLAEAVQKGSSDVSDRGD